MLMMLLAICSPFLLALVLLVWAKYKNKRIRKHHNRAGSPTHCVWSWEAGNFYAGGLETPCGRFVSTSNTETTCRRCKRPIKRFEP